MLTLPDDFRIGVPVAVFDADLDPLALVPASKILGGRLPDGTRAELLYEDAEHAFILRVSAPGRPVRSAYVSLGDLLAPIYNMLRVGQDAVTDAALGLTGSEAAASPSAARVVDRPSVVFRRGAPLVPARRTTAPSSDVLPA